MTHLDLFSGIGGFAIAAQRCGYTTIGFCENEPYAQQVLKERFGAVLGNCPRIHPDIFTLNGADYAGVDLLTGGFPCQPFSVAGKHRGTADDRALWPEMLRVIVEAQPAWIIGENVAGIVTMELDNILSDLEGIGYACWPIVIPACAVDARHRRDRVWIVAHTERSASGQGRTERSGTAGARSHHELAGSGENVAHTASQQDNGERGHRERGRDGMGRNEQSSRRRNGQADHDGTCGQGEDVADSRSRGQSGPGEPIHAKHPAAAGNGQATEPFDGGRPAQWLPEPELGRVAHGIPHRTHRLRGLGNAIVPQVAEEIIRLISAPPEHQGQRARPCACENTRSPISNTTQRQDKNEKRRR